MSSLQPRASSSAILLGALSVQRSEVRGQMSLTKEQIEVYPFFGASFLNFIKMFMVDLS